jgi:ADP-ribose pyrophosphatase
MKHDGGWTRRASRYLYESRWFNLRQDEVSLPTGEQVTYTLVEHPGYVMVVPLLGDGRVILERVYRYTVQETVLECPSGGLDGDTPELAARRELEEETGDGISDERFYLFLATELSQSGEMNREPTEQIEIEFVPLRDAAELALSGSIRDAPSALALILAQRKLGQVA